MEYQVLHATLLKNNREEFEHIENYILNHILEQGRTVTIKQARNGKGNPLWSEEQYAFVAYDRGFYFYHIDAVSRNKARELEVVVGSIDKPDLENRVDLLKRNTNLEAIS